MKNMWKWITGVVVVLVLAAALVIVPIALHSVRNINYQSFNAPMQPAWKNGPMMDDNNGWQHPPIPGGMNGYQPRPGSMFGKDRSFGQDYHGFNRSSPFGAGFLILGGLARLIPLVLFGALLFGVYQLGKRSGRRESLTPAAVQASAPTPAAEPAPTEKPTE